MLINYQNISRAIYRWTRSVIWNYWPYFHCCNISISNKCITNTKATMPSGESKKLELLTTLDAFIGSFGQGNKS